MSDNFSPFVISVGDDEIADLKERLEKTRWPDHLPDTGWDYGIDANLVKELAEYWKDEFDWRSFETYLNSFNNLTTDIDGQRIHIIHERSKNPDALPLLISHGWPGSIVEFLDVIGPLTNPQDHGGDESDAFHVIVPSLPGYGLSGPTSERGWGPTRIARAFADLSRTLGYDRYGVQGGDWGSIISREICRVDPENVAGCHITMLTGGPPGKPDDMEDITDIEQKLLDRAAWYQAEDDGYFRIQQTRPQTLGTGLNDSPAGLLAWITEKFYGWTDNGGDLLSTVDRDKLLANVSLYWFTGTINSSTRIYYEMFKTLELGFGSTGDTPVGVSVFPYELMMPRRRWVEDSMNLVLWSEHKKGGHFASLETPEVFVEDVRECFRGLR
ncbi:MAG TPA: epoxide hydrolase [Acidimicrobiales bacterium]|nr:epoxide hydrolase [Acidimicrobiales bacterium]